MPKAWEIVRDAQTSSLGLPELQRGFMWTPAKIAGLADSMYRGWPIGSMIIWKPRHEASNVVARSGGGLVRPKEWVIDGQQRATAMCVMFGTRPSWLSLDAVPVKIRFNPATETFKHQKLTAAELAGKPRVKDRLGRGRPPTYVDIHELLSAADDEIDEVIERIIETMKIDDAKKVGSVTRALGRVAGMRNFDVAATYTNAPLEDIPEIFNRVNSRGTRVKTADVALAIAAAANPGWKSGHVLPFLDSLERKGWDLQPTQLLIPLIALWRGETKLDAVTDHWGDDPDGMMEAWESVRRAVIRLADYFSQYGARRTTLMPGKSALVPLTVLAALFPEVLESGRPLSWMLQAARAKHYSGSVATKVSGDVLAVLAVANRDEPGDHEEAMAALEARIDHDWDELTFGSDEFLEPNAGGDSKLMKWLMALIAADGGATDWDDGSALQFFGDVERVDDSPEWHHVFPKDHLSQHGVPADRRNLIANLALLQRPTNRKIRSKAPATYLAELKTPDGRLRAQQVPTDRELLKPERYEAFLTMRARLLAQAANNYVAALQEDVAAVDDVVIDAESTVELAAA